MSLITLQELKDYLKIVGEAEDEYFSALIDEAQDTMAEEFPKLRASANYTKDFDGDDSNLVVLDHVPVTMVTQVLTDIESVASVAADDYVVHNNAGLVKLKAGIFPKGIKNCRVAYTAGYTAATFPKAAKHGLLQLCSLLFSLSGRSGETRLGKQSINTPDGGTVSFVHQLPPHTQRSLSKYRDVRLG